MASRPTLRTDAIIESILDQHGDGVPIMQICRQEGMPKLRTFYDWVERDPDLAARFARARKAAIDNLAQETLDIANTPIEGVRRKITEDGVEETREDMLGHRKLQVETRLKLLSCWDAGRYGPRQQVEHSGKLGLEQLVSSFGAGDE